MQEPFCLRTCNISYATYLCYRLPVCGIKYAKLQPTLGQNFVLRPVPRDTPAKPPSLPRSPTASSLLGSNSMLEPKWGKETSFDQGAHVCKLFQTRAERKDRVPYQTPLESVRSCLACGEINTNVFRLINAVRKYTENEHTKHQNKKNIFFRTE